MGRFTKQVILGLTAALTLGVGGALADALLDDFEKGTNENRFGAYWYFYTNTFAKKTGNWASEKCDKVDFSDALTADNMERITNAEVKGKEMLFKGSYGSAEFPAQSGKYAGIMEFANLSSPWNSVDPTAATNNVYPGVGMGTGLTQDTITGMGADFNPTAIKFYLKVSDPTVVKKVKFKIEFATQIAGNGNSWDCNADASYEWEIDDASTAWQQYTVPLKGGSGGLTRPDWEKDKPYTFDLKKALKVAWFIEGASLGGAKEVSAKIAVDSVVFVGYNFVDKWLCPSCTKPATSSPPAGAKIFTNFDSKLGDNNGLAQNALGEYWYAYDDGKAREGLATPGTASTIDAGTTEDEYYTDGPSLDMTGDNTFGYGGTKGAFIQFTMGTPYKDKSGENVMPFVGLGTNLADVDNDGPLYDGSQMTAIWLRYRTSDDIGELFVEVQDKYAIEHDDAEVFYTKLPGTGGEWLAAEIPLSALRLPSWAKNRVGADATLNKAALGKIQFKNQGETGSTLQIDDVYLLDPGLPTVGVKLAGSRSVGVSALRAAYSRGNVGVNWNTASQVAGGKVQLVNTKGRVVASAPIASAAGRITANLGAGKIPTGMYFVRVNAKDVNGKKLSAQTPVSIVK
jgi:hypothetical protein